MQIEEISAASLLSVICKNRLYYHPPCADEERREEPSVKENRGRNVLLLRVFFLLFIFFPLPERLHAHLRLRESLISRFRPRRGIRSRKPASICSGWSPTGSIASSSVVHHESSLCVRTHCHVSSNSGYIIIVYVYMYVYACIHIYVYIYRFYKKRVLHV